VGVAFLAAALVALGGAEVRAVWSCAPASVEVGEPFALVLELTHPATLSGAALGTGALALDESWVVLAESPARTEPGAEGLVRTRRTWTVASLEPGTRSLSDAAGAFGLPAEVTRIQLGGAQVTVAGVLGEGEDEPRPLREFPADFVPEPPADAGPSLGAWIALGLLLVGGGALLAWRARRGPAPAAEPVPLERLRALQTELATGDGRASCYALTGLLREATDRSRRAPRPGLSDEEWLAEVVASHDVPAAVVAELEAVLARTSEVKYAGGKPTPWALEEIFTRARAALEGLGTGGARA